jgi:SAM-dependent methyltransferase
VLRQGGQTAILSGGRRSTVQNGRVQGGPQAYDRIGVGYAAVRRPDPRLAAMIAGAIGDAETIVNVGAGTGSYEPPDRAVVAVEPSSVMLAQHRGTRRVQGTAEHLPFDDATFDVAMAVLTVHHWDDLNRGLAELRRVSRRQVVFTWDPAHRPLLWIVADYVPAIGVMETARFAFVPRIVAALGAHTVSTFEIPHDFTDGFQAAFWRRPEMYLDPAVRSASSTFASLPRDKVEPGIERLRRDLESGNWHRTYGDLLLREKVDYGYRLIVAGESGR